ncbi:hypothetical protein CHS0354_019701 [Potamilus streckersoni]|uniref:Uncharacterized protein n=1 Tax=Potamilus streckersoni TaxID=2493646 RepID=A0AAE0VRU1_9BIVA|nr:hypothetical protein CHS0354_019701 [Potamilus streckersoni]
MNMRLIAFAFVVVVVASQAAPPAAQFYNPGGASVIAGAGASSGSDPYKAILDVLLKLLSQQRRTPTVTPASTGGLFGGSSGLQQYFLYETLFK